MVEKTKKGTEIERSRSKHLVIRLRDDEREEVDAMAEHDRVNISDVIRRALRAEFARMFPNGLPKRRSR